MAASGIGADIQISGAYPYGVDARNQFPIDRVREGAGPDTANILTLVYERTGNLNRPLRSQEDQKAIFPSDVLVLNVPVSHHPPNTVHTSCMS